MGRRRKISIMVYYVIVGLNLELNTNQIKGKSISVGYDGDHVLFRKQFFLVLAAIAYTNLNRTNHSRGHMPHTQLV